MVSGSMTIFFTKWGNFDSELGEKLQSSGVRKANERNRGNRFWQPTPSFNPILVGDRLFIPIGILQKLKFFYNQKKEEITHPLQAYLRDLKS